MKYVLLLVCTSGICKAEDDVRPHEIDNKQWVCFTEIDAQALLDIRMKFPVLKQKIVLLEESISLKAKQISKLEEIRLLQDDQIVKLTQLNYERRPCIENQFVWYRSGWFWAVTGIVVGAGATTAIICGSGKC